VRISEKAVGLFRVEVPFWFADGDSYQVYLKETQTGFLRVTDLGFSLARSETFDCETQGAVRFNKETGEVFTVINTLDDLEKSVLAIVLSILSIARICKHERS
jgi:hypothetical protein